MLKIKDPNLKMENLRLDWGCGWNRESGFLGVDVKDIACVDIVCDMEGATKLPEGCCELIRSQHFIEHLECYQVIEMIGRWLLLLKTGGKLQIFFPDMALIDPLINEKFALNFAFGQRTDEWDVHKSFWTLNTLSKLVMDIQMDSTPGELTSSCHVYEIPFISKHHQVRSTAKYSLDLEGKIHNWTSGIEAVK